MAPKEVVFEGVTLPLKREHERELDLSHEGGIYVSIKENKTREDQTPNGKGVREEKQEPELRAKRTNGSNGAESSTGVRTAAVHADHGEIALLNEDDQVQIYGEAYCRCWVVRLRSDLQKENVKQHGQQLSVWLQALRAKVLRPEDCAKAIMGISLEGNGIYAVVALHRSTSYKSLRRSVISATGIGSDSKSSAAIEISQESEKNLRGLVELIKSSTHSTFSFGMDGTSPDRRKQKLDSFQNVDIQASSLAEIALLTSDIQFKASCIQWRPTGNRCIAVGCSRGVCIWYIKVDMNLRAKHLGYLDSATDMIFLQCHGQARSISWSPCGRLLVVSIDKPSAPLLVWDVSLGVNTRLSPGLNKGVAHFLKWSPCGNYLLTATESGSFFIWETHNWSFRKWSFKHKMIDAVWITEYNVILASFEGLASLQQIRFSQKEPSLNIHLMQLSLPGISESVEADTKPESQSISSMCWDMVNDNLVVTCSGVTRLFPSNKINLGSDNIFDKGLGRPGLLSWNEKDNKLAVYCADSKLAIFSIKCVPVVSASLCSILNQSELF